MDEGLFQSLGMDGFIPEILKNENKIWFGFLVFNCHRHVTSSKTPYQCKCTELLEMLNTTDLYNYISI